MKINPAILIGIIVFGFYNSKAQISVESEIGGSNFLGLTINGTYSIPISDNQDKKIIPFFGLGMLVPGYDDPTAIIHYGANYRNKKWGIGLDASSFVTPPFSNMVTYGSFVDLILYPNISYCIDIKNKFYFKISAGGYFAFSGGLIFQNSPKGNLEFEGDVIPGLGLTFGYKLFQKPIIIEIED